MEIEITWQIWLVGAIVLLITEVFTSGFVVACFSFGALFASLASAFQANTEVQLLVFSIATLVSFFFLRPLLIKWENKRGGEIFTNADAIIGRKGKVTESILPHESGRIKIDGDDWKAISESNTTIETGETVEVIKRDSIILTVKRIEL